MLLRCCPRQSLFEFMLKRGDHSKQLYLNCYCDAQKRRSLEAIIFELLLWFLPQNFRPQKERFQPEQIFRRLYERSIPERYHSSSLSLCVIFSRHIYFFLSRSHTHTIFLHLSQIFKANINAALFALAMKIKGGTEDCFPVFLFLFLISFFTLSHKNESYRHQASVACMR